MSLDNETSSVNSVFVERVNPHSLMNKALALPPY